MGLINQYSREFEDKLRAAMSVSDDGKIFLFALRKQLMEHPVKKSPKRPFQFARPLWVGTLILILIMITVIVLGPQKVYAAFRHLFGYIPGVGFISTDNGFALQEPVAQTRDGRTFQVEQLIASNEETVLVVRLTGFPTYQEIGLDQGIAIELADGYARYPGDKSVEVTSTPGEYLGVFKFHALTADNNNVTVIWKQPALQGIAAADWKIKVQLFPVTDPAVLKVLPVGYGPDGASDTESGITLNVEQVSVSQTDTGIQMSFIYPQPFIYFNSSTVQLSDDLGNIYAVLEGLHSEDQGQLIGELSTQNAGPQVLYRLVQTLKFPPVSPDASQLMLNISSVNFRAAPDVAFAIDLGSHPVIGDSWPVNSIISLDDLSLHVKKARLVNLDQDAPGSSGQAMVGLVLDIEALDPDQVEITQIWLRVSGIEPIFDAGTATWAPSWTADSIPSGVVNLSLKLLDGKLKAHWQMQWEHQNTEQ
jgi:hypothetical protein